MSGVQTAITFELDGGAMVAPNGGDYFELTWQIKPKDIARLFSGADPERTKRLFAELMTMGKLDIAALQPAFQEIG